jgi:hypothetical protein
VRLGVVRRVLVEAQLFLVGDRELVLAVPGQAVDEAGLACLLQRGLLQPLSFGVGVVVEADVARAQFCGQLGRNFIPLSKQ